MRNQSFGLQIAAAGLGLTVFFAASCRAASPAQGSYSNPGITNPSEMRGLNFNVPGVVSKVHVKEGDLVKKGDVLAQQDDSVDLAELAVKELEASGSTLQIDAAQKDLDEKKVILERSEKEYKTHVIGKEDLEKAQLDVAIGGIRVTLAETESKQKVGEVTAEKAKIAQKKLLSTIDGIVQKINVHDGELATNDPKTPCMQIVSNEPLYVEIYLPVAEAARLQLKQAMDVRYLDLPSDNKWHEAQIIFFNPVSDARASTQLVRLQLENPNHLRSGVQMEVAPSDPKHEKAVAIAAPAR
jgi:RND family efflux transporter MFP subunit